MKSPIFSRQRKIRQDILHGTGRDLALHQTLIKICGTSKAASHVRSAALCIKTDLNCKARGLFIQSVINGMSRDQQAILLDNLAPAKRLFRQTLNL